MPLRHILTAALIATIAVYWAGLAGPFLFDDFANLAQIELWLAGRASWYEAVFGTQSGLLLRPVSMASFALNAYVGGMSPVPFKLVNLILHLICGILIWQLVRRLLAQDARLSPHAALIASVVAAIWLLHPLHASTVLYVVQRMTQLSCLFVLGALCVYVSARQALQAGREGMAGIGLFVGFPLFMLAGLLSKENAAVGVLLCLLLEVSYFSQTSRLRMVRVFLGAMVFAPLAIATIYVLAKQDALLSGYEVRDFTLMERLLSQTRALSDYVFQLLAPRGASMGLYTDDFAPSHSLITPRSTLLSLLFLSGASLLAWMVRRRMPVVFCGWFFFLFAHSVESTFLPLELYFEHRNYLPSVGLLLALVGGIGYLATSGTSRRRISITACVIAGAVFILILGGSTLDRALVWRSMEGIATAGVTHHPSSLRANLDYATLGLQTGRYDMSMRAMQQLSDSEEKHHRFIGRLGMISIDCIRDQKGNPADLQTALQDAPPRITLSEYQALGLLARIVAERTCGEVTTSRLADTVVDTLAAAASQSDQSEPKWRLRMVAAQQLARASRLSEALVQARLAWQPNADVGVGSTLAHIYARLNRWEDAEATLGEMEERLGRFDTHSMSEIQQLRQQLLELNSKNET